MVAVFNKDLLSWYLVTLKLKEKVEGKSQPTTPASKAPPLLTQAGEPAAPPNPPQDSEWVISIREKLEQARQLESFSPWAKLSIYRVPKSLREGDEKAYFPQVVSIGPYHRSRRRLRDMDSHKWRALHHVLKRTGHDIHLYLHAVKSLEDKARSCYEGHIHLSSDEFVEVMVLDGVFMLELFRGAAGEGFTSLGYSHCDPVFAVRGTMHSIQRDMIMLENQIPLFVLGRLLGLQLGLPEQGCGLVARLAIQFLDPLMPTYEPLNQSDRFKLEFSAAAFDPLSEGGLHCLDVFRCSLLRAGPRPAPGVWLKRWSDRARVCDKRRQQLVHCVTELRDSGIKFRKRRTDRFWDIEFKNGVLHIPRLLIHDGTKSLFLNLIAFEQCHMNCSNDITSYVIFMDNLIDSEEDVRYLHYRGIIEHWLGNDDEVADMFNKLCQEVVFDMNDGYLSGLSGQVNRYYNHRWNSWRASLKHKYFNNPWAIISFIAAVVLLVLTLAQTFYSVYGYYRPNS
ncbi:UPF0481 protein At3g47200-like [Phoenix dactylifera]|uniref:UPF0481 protein At3g47200-like n=1 Tax=Phoenix dactylifera TaxID=42345 RepID=A0A8B7BKZ4_PHODC|nr:UPF0481 protein At3g47200-like [Phoenix dactylifera]